MDFSILSVLSVLDVGFVAWWAAAWPVISKLLPYVITAAGVIFSSKSSSNSNKKATTAALTAQDRAIAWEREQDELDRRERAQIEEENRRRADIEADREQARYDTQTQDDARQEALALKWRQLNDRRLQPVRDTGIASVQELGRLAGLTIRPTEGTPDLASGWDEESLSPPRYPGPVVATGRRGMSDLLR